MHVVAKVNKEKEIDFFVFDMEKTLIVSYKMKAGYHHKIAGLAGGSYTYNIFCGAEEIAMGNFMIK